MNTSAVIGQILEERLGSHDVADGLFVDPPAAVDSIQRQFPRGNEEDLRKMLRAANSTLVSSYTQGAFFWLKPLEKDKMLPVVGLTMCFKKSKLEFRIKMALFGTHRSRQVESGAHDRGTPQAETFAEDRAETEQADQGLVAVGLRFERPEGTQDNQGSHDYFHCQFSSRLYKAQGDAGYLPGMPRWFPVHQPAFPLDATTEIGLTLTFCTSLYGLQWLETFRERPVYRGEVEKQTGYPSPPGLWLTGSGPVYRRE